MSACIEIMDLKLNSHYLVYACLTDNNQQHLLVSNFLDIVYTAFVYHGELAIFDECCCNTLVTKCTDNKK